MREGNDWSNVFRFVDYRALALIIQKLQVKDTINDHVISRKLGMDVTGVIKLNRVHYY